MPIPIIGQTSQQQNVETQQGQAAAARPAPKVDLPVPEVSLPPPESAPENAPILSKERLKTLAGHESALVRSFAIERIISAEDPELDPLVIAAVADPDPEVAEQAIRAVGQRKIEAGAGAVAARFRTASGPLAAAAASALGRLSADRLIEEIRARPRLDDHSYAIATAELARSGTPAAIEFLTKSMNRAGALDPERRSALYASALLSGVPEVADRVVLAAIADSKAEEPEEGTRPARAALASLGGLPITLAPKKAASRLIKQLRDDRAQQTMKILDEAGENAIEDALRREKPGDIFPLLQAVVDRPAAPDGAFSGEPEASILRRRRGLLRALLKQTAQITQLEPAAQGLFAAVALDAAMVIAVAASAPSELPAMKHVSAALGVQPSDLGALSDEALKDLFGKKTEREIRRVLNILSHEALPEVRLDKLARAAFEAGHGVALIDAAADGEQLAMAVLRVAGDVPVKAEAAALEVLARRPLEPGPATIGIALAANLATERLSLALGRRFMELRQVARGQMTDAVLRMGDPRLLPLVAARSYPGEPEELVQVVLTLLAGQPVEGALAEAKTRLERAHEQPAPEAEGEGEEPKIYLPLRCKACGETLTYSFFSVWVDPESKATDGDPAYVGEVVCKACGAEDMFEPTPQAVMTMTQEMMTYLQAAKRGEQADLLVVPRKTRVDGKAVGLAEALRIAEKGVASEPDSVRARLRRARVRLTLRRVRGAREDAEAIMRIDPESVEGLLALAGVELLEKKTSAGLEHLIRAKRLLDRTDPEVRLYDYSRAEAENEVGAGLLHVEEIGQTIPADIDLREARRDRDMRRAEAQARVEQMMAAREAEEEQRAAGRPESSEAGTAGFARNALCPCGSGLKYKRCHGA